MAAVLASCTPIPGASAAPTSTTGESAADPCSTFDIRSPAGEIVDLTGTWSSDHNLLYYAFQTGDCLWITGGFETSATEDIWRFGGLGPWTTSFRGRLTAVGTAFRYEQHSTIVRAQIGSVPSAIRRRLGSKIDDNVKNSSPNATDEFGLKRRCDLIVHSADRARPNAQSHVGLYRREIDFVIRKLALAPSSHETTTTIVQRRRLDKPGAKNPARMKFHRRVSVYFGESKRLLGMRR
jgi:hypothetical protein